MTTISNAQELQSKVKELGLSFRRKVATTNSEYIIIDGRTYRISDHYQPSHYQVRNYTDCNSYHHILELVLAIKKQSSIINTWDEYLYDKDTDGFYLNENFISEHTKPSNFIN